MTTGNFPLIAVDIGNSRIKLGLFEHAPSVALPEPVRTLTIDPNWPEAQLLEWLPAAPDQLTWWVSSVQRTVSTHLFDWLTAQKVKRKKLLVAADLPLIVELEYPDRVGMDRLIDAVSVNRLRTAGHAAVIVDLGTAITVDLVSASGAFQGGTIMPGVNMAARALHQFTDLLPQLTVSELADPPPALGTSTTTAMQSGLYWGAIGAIRELIARLSDGLDHVQVFLTGGAAPTVAELLANKHAGRSLGQTIYVPHLALAGIALAAAHDHA